MEHHARDRILLAFDRDNKFFPFKVVSSNNFEKITQCFTFSVSFCLDSPVVRMVKYVLVLHLFQELVWEVFKHIAVFLNIFNYKFHWS